MQGAVQYDSRADRDVSTIDADRTDYVPLMLDVMSQQGVGIRALALRTRIGKSRLGLILHRDVRKRSVMTLSEFHRVLNALEIDLLEAVVTVEVCRETSFGNAARHRQLIAMLCGMFRDLPVNLISALDDVDGVDGTEVRAEWAPVLQRAVIKRLVHEIAAVVSRRAALSDFNIFN